jgi:hypothetical protein
MTTTGSFLRGEVFFAGATTFLTGEAAAFLTGETFFAGAEALTGEEALAEVDFEGEAFRDGTRSTTQRDGPPRYLRIPKTKRMERVAAVCMTEATTALAMGQNIQALRSSRGKR